MAAAGTKFTDLGTRVNRIFSKGIVKETFSPTLFRLDVGLGEFCATVQRGAHCTYSRTPNALQGEVKEREHKAFPSPPISEGSSKSCSRAVGPSD